MLEKQIEHKLVTMVRERGGLCLKFVSPGTPGVPDRIVITPDGRVFFVELKTESGRLTKYQAHMAAELEKRNANVRTLFGLSDVESFVREVMP